MDLGFNDGLESSGINDYGEAHLGNDDVKELSRTATIADRWTLRTAEDHIRRNPISKQLAEAVCRDRSDLDVDYMFTDCFNVMFSRDIEVADTCVSPERLDFIKQVINNEEFTSIRKSTRGHSAKSLASAYRIAEAYGDYIAEQDLDSRRPQPEPEPSHWLDGLDDDEGEGEGEGESPSGPSQEQKDSMEKHLGEAAQEIDEDLEIIENLEKQFGEPGDGHQACANENEDMQTLAETFKRVRRIELLHEISRMSGRYISLAKTYRKGRVPYGAEDMDGLTIGNHVGRLTTTELSRSRNPLARMDLMRRIADSQASIKNVHGYDSLGKGPIAVVLDESGSMSGHRIIHAKAIAMTFAWIARRQRRECIMYSYEGGGRDKLLKLPVGKWSHAAMCEYLESFLCGGGYVDLPIRELPDKWQEFDLPKGKTDVIMISDGHYSLDSIGPESVERFNKWRQEEEASVTTICISSAHVNVLESVSDRIHCVPHLSEDDKEIGKIFASA